MDDNELHTEVGSSASMADAWIHPGSTKPPKTVFPSYQEVTLETSLSAVHTTLPSNATQSIGLEETYGNQGDRSLFVIADIRAPAGEKKYVREETSIFDQNAANLQSWL